MTLYLLSKGRHYSTLSLRHRNQTCWFFNVLNSYTNTNTQMKKVTINTTGEK